MSVQTIAPRIRGFICLNAHPAGCASNVEKEVEIATRQAPGQGLRDALVIGASTGYGLSSLVSTVFGYGARAMGICLERPPQGDKTASAGWYNLAAVQRLAKARGREVSIINGDAFSDEIKAQATARLASAGAKLDCVVYSLASPKRTDPRTGTTLQLGAQADRRAVSQQDHQPGKRPGDRDRNRARRRRRDRGDAQGDGGRGSGRLDPARCWTRICWPRAAGSSPTATSGPS